MLVLANTSSELSKYANACEYLKPFAGPQCFPQLQDAERREANDLERLRASREAGGEASSATGGFFKGCAWDCWRQCDACRVWRLLDPEAVGVLTTEACDERAEHRSIEWRAWLASAPAGYAVFEQLHDPEKATLAGQMRAELGGSAVQRRRYAGLLKKLENGA